MSTPNIYIIILTYNMSNILRQCLISLRNLDYQDYHVVVVDNASSDGTETMVRSEFPDIYFIQTGKNTGYTGGNNQGMEYALAKGADYVLILNPDIILVNPQFLRQMVDYCEAHPDVGIAGPKVFLRDPATVQNTILLPPSLWRNIKHWFLFRLVPSFGMCSGGEIRDAEVLNGVCLLIRSDCLRETGLFDDNIFMYIEDVDMQHRVHQKGWKIRYLPIDSILHMQKEYGYHMTGMVSFLLRRNTVYFLHKTGKKIDAWGYAVLSILLMLARGVMTFRYARLMGHISFCRKLYAAYKLILLDRRLNTNFGPPLGPFNT